MLEKPNENFIKEGAQNVTDDVAVMGACLFLVEQDLHMDWKQGQE